MRKPRQPGRLRRFRSIDVDLLGLLGGVRDGVATRGHILTSARDSVAGGQSRSRRGNEKQGNQAFHREFSTE